MACGGSGDLAVSSNALEVSSLVIERGDQAFDLTGLDEQGAERAHFALRVDDAGTRIEISALADRVQLVTPETHVAHQTMTGYAQVDAFLRLPEVVAALDREAGIHVLTPDELGAVDETPYLSSCPADKLLVTPLARQCCWDGLGTTFVNDSNFVVRRIYNYAHGGAGCKAADGVGACSGLGCYYGPLGFAVWTMAQGNAPYIYPKVQPQFSLCAWAFYPTPQTPIYANVTGTQPRGLTCPGSATAKWDYPAP